RHRKHSKRLWENWLCSEDFEHLSLMISMISMIYYLYTLPVVKVGLATKELDGFDFSNNYIQVSISHRF
ncbi:MAG: hypothetical protein LBQ86_00415, partial [Holophagales bacterium]|nr:hypothetical protein [Holophagales bacterium]